MLACLASGCAAKNQNAAELDMLLGHEWVADREAECAKARQDVSALTSTLEKLDAAIKKTQAEIKGYFRVSLQKTLRGEDDTEENAALSAQWTRLETAINSLAVDQQNTSKALTEATRRRTYYCPSKEDDRD
ncbi:hypothetical protein HY933_04695 [Candidatus Falkowbacteria bacterium]|nr:hypothetical protein [Candidatus Falkowbacteria bacterium]